MIVRGDAVEVLWFVAADSVDLGFCSPPYLTRMPYEGGMDFGHWSSLVSAAVEAYGRVVRPGGFLALKMADILRLRDDAVRLIQSVDVDRRRCAVTRSEVLGTVEQGNVGRGGDPAAGLQRADSTTPVAE